MNFLANVLFAELLTRCGTYCASEQANCTGEKMEKVVKCVKPILSGERVMVWSHCPIYALQSDKNE